MSSVYPFAVNGRPTIAVVRSLSTATLQWPILSG